MPDIAVINPDGTVAWQQAVDRVTAARIGPGSYTLTFGTDCDRDVFVIHAKTAGLGGDAPRVVATTVQSDPRQIYVTINRAFDPTVPIDAQFSYIRYRRADANGVGDDVPVEGGCPQPAEIETRDWYAWLNEMPPKPNDFHVTGEVLVPNPGVDIELVTHSPQGFNPRILILDLLLIQRPGIWPQVLTWKPARYDKVVSDDPYDEVTVLYQGQSVAQIPVDRVS
jgi:hypothetical protein